MLDTVKYIAVALAIALLGMLIVRPIITRLLAIPAISESAGPSTGSRRAALGDGVASDATATAEGEVELREGETLEELKARMKPKKKGISADLLDTANSYDDKVTVVRMLVSQDSKRVALGLKNLIGRDLSK